MNESELYMDINDYDDYDPDGYGPNDYDSDGFGYGYDNDNDNNPDAVGPSDVGPTIDPYTNYTDPQDLGGDTSLFLVSTMFIVCSASLLYKLYGCVKMQCRRESLRSYVINHQTIDIGPVSRTTINGLPGSPSINVDPCSICLEPFVISDKSITLRCGHKYHTHCIIDWLQRDNICPLCRQVVPLN